MCWELITTFNLLKIKMRVDIFGTEKCKVTFGLKYIMYLPLCSCLAFSCAEHIVRHSCNSGLGIRPAGSVIEDSYFLACHQFVSSLLITCE